MRTYNRGRRVVLNGNGVATRHSLTSDRVFHSLVNNYLLSQPRAGVENLIDQSGRRDIDAECDYPAVLDIRVYRHLYGRVAIANRAIRIFPDECWSSKPEVYQREKYPITAWERQFNRLLERHQLWHYCHRWDVATRIGRYGGMLVGLNDRRPLRQPVAGVAEDGTKIPRRGRALPREVLFLRPLAEDHLEVVKTDRDVRSPRFGQPLLYRLKLRGSRTSDRPNFLDDLPEQDVAGADEEPLVHWTRVVHSAEGREACEWRAMPVLQPIANLIWDCRKVLGGAAEMFWKGAFFGISFETHPGINEFVEVDMDELKDEIEAFQNGLQRFLRLVNMSAKSLAPQVADPSKHMQELYRLIAAVIGVPLPIFMGAESGKSDGGTNAALWNRRLMLRNEDYLEPRMIRPLVDRFMLLDVLPPTDSYVVSWKDLNTQTEKDKADVALKLTQALLQYVTSGAMNLVAPKQYFVRFLKFDDATAEAMIAAAGGEAKIKQTLKTLTQAQAGNTPGTKPGDPTRRTGAGGNRNGQARRRSTAVKRST